MTHCLRVAALVAAAAVMTADGRAQTATPAATPVPVETLFADASAKETAVRKALAASSPAPTALKAVRTVVADFENLVRRFPSSGYCDDALWRAAQLSRDGFARFGELHEQMTAIRLLQTLQSQYASSKWAKLAPAQLAALRAAVPPLPPSGQAVVPLDALPTPERVAASRAHSVPPRAPRSRETPSPAPGRVATIKDIRRATIGDTIRIVVELDMEVVFRDERLEHPSRIFVDLSRTRASEKFKEQTIRFESDGDPVRHVRIGRHPNATTRIVLEAAGISSHSVYPLYSPYRLVIDCLRSTPAQSLAASRPIVAPVEPAPPPVLPMTPPAWLPQSPAVVPVPSPFPVQSAIPSYLVALRVSAFADSLPAVAPTGGAAIADALTDPVPANLPASPVVHAASAAVLTPLPLGAPSRNLAGGISIARQLGLSVSRIVIDPGHGGHDSGAKGEGTTEADVVLDIALRLEKLFERAADVHVVLTRREDRYLTLQERTAIANRENADLFLSIHANASSNRQVHGIETYFLNFASNLSAAAVAARENAASGQTMGELPDVVKSIALHSKLDESRDFATFLQREMVARLRPANKELRDLGVKQAPFVVLIGAAMPSVLTEVSFLTNSREAKLLKGAAYRQRIAEALFDGIRKYQSTLGVISIAAAQPQP
jgi:N-acetylmuramoyl-L-alanine amidase